MKRILGLDLGTTSIGFAYVKEAENDREQSSVEQIGVRVNPLTTDEQTDFEKGKPVSVNAGRTLKRGMRRNLDRYQLRRDNLIEVLKNAKFISDDSILAEDGKNTTFETWRLRAKSATQKIEKEELARVFLAINKKRGYKSSRKAKNEDEGQVIDGMSVAKKLYEQNLTPGQYVYQLLQDGKKAIPDFYRSDLQSEFDKVWNFQKQFYPEIFTDEFYKELQGKGQRATSASFWGKYQFNTAENKGTRDEKKLQAYKWRSKAVSQQLEKEQAAYVITEINNNLNQSSGYLGAISDRSKELYFNKETVGQYLYRQLQQNPHTRLKNQVFYRQDYLDEFEQIWETQAKFHSELTNELKTEIRDIIIFYQRKLKSQKGLISFCEFESKEIEINGKKKMIGLRVTPKSSPLFQEFKIWQVLNNLEFRNKETKERLLPDLETKQYLFDELNIKGNLTANKILEILGYKPKDWEVNYKIIEGNRTNQSLYEAYLQILDLEGYDVKNLLKVKTNKDEVELSDLKVSALEIKKMVRQIFESIGISTKILDFNSELDGKDFEQQSQYQLWHLLYSYEGDDSASGNEKLYELLAQKFGFKREHSQILANISLSDDYGNLSTKAMRRIFPFVKEHNYADASLLAGYRHSKNSLTKEEIDKRVLKPELELLKKNSLRNPVVEKILNQMVNVVNTLIETNSEKDPNFRFDEIRIELARELKKNAKERAEMTANINSAKIQHDKINKILQNEFGVKNPTRNDIIRYKLYEELKNNGYKDLYTNTYIPREKLFTKEIDIEHIIPKAKVFDDSFSNKTLAFRNINIEKGNKTAIEYIAHKLGNTEAFEERIKALYESGQKNKEEGISKTKYQKLLKKESEIGDGFIERDLRDSQYIAKKAKNMLFEITKNVVSTSGSITDRLREDWDLVNVMQELNFDKFKKLGLTEQVEKKDGTTKERIVDWTKRNDHRHHAMDALTVAFTKRSFIQYLNNLNARRKDEKNEGISNSDSRKSIETSDLKISTKDVMGIEEKELHRDIEGKLRFNLPVPNFRQIAKGHLENVLVSHKAKNKVVTKNKNKTKSAKGEKTKIELTPRGQLHKETVYGRIKNEKGQYDYTIRKDVSPDLKLDKVIDQAVKTALENRLKEFGNDPKKAFVDLDKNPIWLNKAKGISVKRVTISGVRNAEALHYKKDHKGNAILDEQGNPIPADFVSTGNNHHVAIYRDEKGNLRENVVSFFEAVTRVNQSFPIIDKTYNQELGWQFLFTMKQNEYFVFPNEQTGFNPNEIDLLDPQNKRIISPNLFRVQKLATKNYMFRHHLETNVEENKSLRKVAWELLQTPAKLESIVKVRINHIGNIVSVGEY